MSANRLNLNDPDDCRAFGRTLAGLLLASLRSKSLDRDYRDLMSAYDDSMPLRMMFNGLLEGMGAEVIERHRNLGLVVGIKDSDSPLLDHIERDAQSPDERRLMAVVLATMLALYYPADALEDPTLSPRPLTRNEVHEKIAQIIDTMRSEAIKSDDGDGVAIWELVSDHMSLKQTASGAYKRNTVAGQIDAMFRTLKKRGLVTEGVSDGVYTYRPTLQLFSFVQNRLNHWLYREISAALSSTKANAAPSIA